MRTKSLSIAGSLIVSASLGALGCGGSNPPVEEHPDAAVTTVDDAGGAGPLCDRIPTTLFGTSEGRRLENFTLPQCDNVDYTLYNEDFCDPDHTLTVISIAAEWCGPCQEESRLFTDTISIPYAPRGVRLIQVIIQNASYGPPDLNLCNRWVRQFNLTHNIEVIDPSGVIAPAFPSGSLPSTLILDETGTIIHREDGAAPGLVTLRAELDRALTARGR